MGTPCSYVSAMNLVFNSGNLEARICCLISNGNSSSMTNETMENFMRKREEIRKAMLVDNLIHDACPEGCYAVISMRKEGMKKVSEVDKN